MGINLDTAMKNLRTFGNAYGQEVRCKKMLQDISTEAYYVESIGVLLRDPVTKKGLLSCYFPVGRDCTREMLWVPIDERPIEAVPICKREKKPGSILKRFWKRMKERPTEGNAQSIVEGNFHLTVHNSLRKRGVIEKFFPDKAYGFVRRTRRGIFFMKKWCTIDEVKEGKEVSFIPVISHKGLQARAIEEV